MKKNITSRRILLAGGGTAGHIEPALAVAAELKKLDPTLACEFIGTAFGLEKVLVPARGYTLHLIYKVALPRRISPGLLLWPLTFAIALLQSIKAIKNSAALIGFGGYVSAPAYIAAWLSKVPIIVHEANAKPGWANRLGRFFAARVAVNFISLRKEWPDAVALGIPLRDEITILSSATLTEITQIRAEQCKLWGFDPSIPVVAIFGGSQGSGRINRVLAEFVARGLENVQIVHAAGMNNEVPLSRSHYFATAYFHDIASVYAASDLVISRSGAVTCSEIAAVNRYALLLPLAHGNGEQEFNAQDLVERGYAEILIDQEFSADWLAKNLALSVAKGIEFKKNHLPTETINSAYEIATLVCTFAKLKK